MYVTSLPLKCINVKGVPRRQTQQRPGQTRTLFAALHRGTKIGGEGNGVGGLRLVTPGRDLRSASLEAGEGQPSVI
jgi:hypothetical protein